MHTRFAGRLQHHQGILVFYMDLDLMNSCSDRHSAVQRGTTGQLASAASSRAHGDPSGKSLLDRAAAWDGRGDGFDAWTVITIGGQSGRSAALEHKPSANTIRGASAQFQHCKTTTPASDKGPAHACAPSQQTRGSAAAAPATNANIVAARGEGKCLTGDFAAALTDLDCAAALEPNDAWTYARRGAVNLGLGNYKAALKDLNLAIILDPEGDAGTLAARGQVHCILGDHSKALVDFDRSDMLKPDDAFVLSRRGEVKGLLGDFKGALEDLDRADELRPGDAYVLSRRGAVQRLLGGFQAALADFDRADAAKSGDAWMLARRGDTKRLMGRFREAAADLDMADALEPNDACTLAWQGASKLGMGEFGAALVDLNRAVALKPGDAWMQARRQEARQCVKMGGEAKRGVSGNGVGARGGTGLRQGRLRQALQMNWWWKFKQD